MKYLSIKTICVLLSVMLVTLSCDNNNNTSEPPTIPSEATMTADFSEMENAEKVHKSSAAESNFSTALFAAGIVKLILDVNLAIPRALTAAAQQHEPNEVADGEWEWEYSTQANQNEFGVRLLAITNSQSDVEWRFFVTNTASDPSLDNALFFQGNTNFAATSGTWIYFEPASSDQVSTLEWDTEGDEKFLKLEVTSDRNDNLGDTIEYSFDGSVKTVTYVDASNSETTTIEYNTETKAGFIISPDHNNGEKSCWDEDLNNISCSG